MVFIITSGLVGVSALIKCMCLIWICGSLQFTVFVVLWNYCIGILLPFVFGFWTVSSVD